MKRHTILALAAYVMTLHASAETLFNVDFEAPTFTNGQIIVAGSAPSSPTDAALAVVSNSVLGFTSQAAMIYADYAGGGVTFETSVYSTGVHIISWEMVNVGGAFNGQTTIDDINIFLSYSSGSPKVFQLWNVLTNYPPTFPPDRVPIVADTANAFRITFDLDDNMLSFAFNGNTIVDHNPIDPDATLRSVSYWQNTSIASEGVRYALDNFHWEVVSHPQMLPAPNGYISWSSESGKIYHVQGASDLSIGTWTNLGAGILATDSSTVVEHPFDDAAFQALRTVLETE